MTNTFEQLYKTLDIRELKKLLESGKLTQGNLYDFLTGYSYYLKQQISMDD